MNTAANTFAWASTFEQGVPNTVGPDLSTGIVQLPGNANMRSPWPGLLHRGYSQTWNFTLERKLPQNLVTSVAYVGMNSVHLLADVDINSGYPGSGTSGLPYYPQFRRTLPTQMWDGGLSSHYHSLQVASRRAFSNGLMLQAAYTFSKAIDYVDDDGSVTPAWNWGPVFQRNRATAGFDSTHVLQIGWVYELPFGKGKMLAQNGIAGAILGNWQVNGVMAAYTGTPFTVSAPGTSLNAPDNIQTANQAKTNVDRIGNVGPGQFYYDPAAFAPVTAIATFGNSGRNILRGPGTWNPDLDITREFSARRTGAAAVPRRILQPGEYVALREPEQQCYLGNVHADHQCNRGTANPVRTEGTLVGATRGTESRAEFNREGRMPECSIPRRRPHIAFCRTRKSWATLSRNDLPEKPREACPLPSPRP